MYLYGSLPMIVSTGFQNCLQALLLAWRCRPRREKLFVVRCKRNAALLPRVPSTRLMYFDRSGGSRVQGSYRHALKTSGHALDRTRLQRLIALRCSKAKRTVSGFLGAQNGTVSGVTYNFSDVHPLVPYQVTSLRKPNESDLRHPSLLKR